MKNYRLILLFLASALALGLSSCATGPEPYGEKISTQPHNRPQSWEGTQALGSFFPGSM